MNEGTGTAVEQLGRRRSRRHGGQRPTLWVPARATRRWQAGNQPPPPRRVSVRSRATTASSSTGTRTRSPTSLATTFIRDGGPTGPTVQAVGAGDIASCSSLATRPPRRCGGPRPWRRARSWQHGLRERHAGRILGLLQPNLVRPVQGTYPPCRRVHEYGTANASGYFGYSGAAARTSQGYYSYDYGTRHVIVLDSMRANVGGCDPGSPQLDWLLADLAANDASRWL